MYIHYLQYVKKGRSHYGLYVSTKGEYLGDLIICGGLR